MAMIKEGTLMKIVFGKTLYVSFPGDWMDLVQAIQDDMEDDYGKYLLLYDDIIEIKEVDKDE